MYQKFVKSVIRISFISVAVLAVVLLAVAGLMIFNPEIFLSAIHYVIAAVCIVLAVYLIIIAFKCISAGTKEEKNRNSKAEGKEVEK